MRQVRYGVAMSLGGYIAGTNGEADWIVMDPDIDFGAIFSRFDTLLIGRRTYAAMQAIGGDAGMAPGVRSVVISRSMRQADHPGDGGRAEQQALEILVRQSGHLSAPPRRADCSAVPSARGRRWT